MNSTIRAAAKVEEQLNKLNENSDTKQLGIQHIIAKLGEFLKKKWKQNVTHGQYVRSMARQLVSEGCRGEL